MKLSSLLLRLLLVSPFSLATVGCSARAPEPKSNDKPAADVATGKIRPASKKQDETENSVKEGLKVIEAGADARRAKWEGKTFEQFERSVFKEPGVGGKYIVSGDTPIADRKHLQEFFEKTIKRKAAAAKAELIVATEDGVQAVWNSTKKKNLTYCVSTAFAGHHQAVVDVMLAATGAWSACGDVAFIHDAAQDATCTASNANVVFDVNPVDVGGEYLARAFFPNEPRAARNVLIDKTSFQLDPAGKLQLAGILRHELGHSLGLRHEHTRPESGACFEDSKWVPYTNYDQFSVMHYPQCNGGGDWSLMLTDRDKSGIACVYGSAPGFQMNPSLITNPSDCHTALPPPSGQTQTKTFRDRRVSQDETKPFGPFAVLPGTRFDAKMSGRGPAPGDPDLYVRFDQAPTEVAYACRPYLTGADESCSIDVPAGKAQAFVMVRGYAPGKFDLKVTFTH